MNKHFKYLILLTLSLMITIGLVYAAPPKIGETIQHAPFESNPQAYTAQDTPIISGATADYDGLLITSAVITLGQDPTGTPFPPPPVPTAYYELTTFKTPVSPEFTTIGWVEIKMKYEAPGTVNDLYRIEYSTDGSTWADLQPDVSGAASEFSPAAIRPWSQLAEPTNGVWTWSDIAGLRVRVFCTKDTSPFDGEWDSSMMVIYEVWATVYPLPLPPASSATVSVQPPVVTGVKPYDSLFAAAGPDGYCFVELYVNDVENVYTYEMWLEFDTNVLTPITGGWTYYPFVRELAPDVLDDTNGWVRMAYGMPTGLETGFYGSTPIARIYFKVDAYGAGNPYTQYGGEGGTTDIHIKPGFPDSFLGNPDGEEIPSNFYDSWFSGPQAMSYQGSLLPDPSSPEGTTWHEDWPDNCESWELTIWEDDPDNIDNVLSASDQIQMANASGWKYWFHVDAVTITIHWTFKDDLQVPIEGDLGAAEPMVETTPVEDGTSIPSPMDTYWHQLYPDYCRWFQITSHEDTDGDGNLDIGEQFDFTYYLEETRDARLDDITTDIIVTQKPIDPEAPEMEFPLGLGLVIAIAPLIPLIYLWRRKRWEK